MLRVIEEIEEEELSDQENRPGGPVGHPKESQRPVDAAEKGKGGDRCVSTIKDTEEFNYDLFNDDFIRNSRALYDDVKILIAEKNDAVEEVYKLR